MEVLMRSLVVLVLLSVCGSAFADSNSSDPVCNLTNTNITGFLCKNGNCIPLEEKCNGYNDCGDNSDEKGCSGSSSGLGYVAATIAALFFGSNFVPVKKYETGDGMFFQWIMCSAIWFVGVFVNFIKGQVPFQPYAALGGVFWATGNLTVVPIVKAIGLAQGLLVWGTINMIMGWAAARFGWFGIVPEVPSEPSLQYIGIVFAGIAVSILAFIETKIKPVNQESVALLSLSVNEVRLPLFSKLTSQDTSKDTMWIEKLPSGLRRITGLLLSVAGGFCYSLTFDPSQYVMDNELGASQDALNYVFSQYSGIFMASTFYFMVYCAYQKSNPIVYPKVILPAFISGIMWAIAQTSWFIANQRLSQAVSYPIVTTLPGIIGTLWGTLLFKEISGKRSYLLLAASYSMTAASVVIMVLSQ